MGKGRPKAAMVVGLGSACRLLTGAPTCHRLATANRRLAINFKLDTETILAISVLGRFFWLLD
ncbi:unnamed protein product [Linum tenue]|uniref:Uncharacterized protein n=1 Tax=Linum tenue TaxID=586396 RepID=A0AAV0NYU9_9ROSI|nr:unnamed protein product [Linum tenue]